MTTLTAPRTPVRGAGSKGKNIEKAGWLYMRISGAVLIVLIFGHLFINLMTGSGVKAIDFAFVAGKLASPFWQVWDLLMLWLALIHGANGMRTIINDYSSPTLGKVLKASVAISAIILIVLGTLVIFTFDPCPAGAPASTLPSFCPAR